MHRGRGISGASHHWNIYIPEICMTSAYLEHQAGHPCQHVLWVSSCVGEELNHCQGHVQRTHRGTNRQHRQPRLLRYPLQGRYAGQQRVHKSGPGV